MAIYHFSAKVISRGTGRSSTAAAAYRAGREIADERTGELHDYTRKRGVLDHAILSPSRAPEWARASATLWNAAEQFEKRKDAQVCREVTVALPNELSLEQNRDMLHGYVKEAFISRGMAAQVDIHAPHRDGDKRNIHAHILLTTRQITRNGFKAKKARNWNEKATLVEWREQWAAHMNRALERANKTGRVDARSFKDQGVERSPSSHLGPAASQMERRGQNTRIGDENRAAVAFNELQRKAKVIDLAAERAKRRQVIAQRAEEAIERGLKRLSTEYGEAADNKTADRWRLSMAQQEHKAVNDPKPPDDRPLEAQDNKRRALLQDRHITERSDIGRRDDVQRQKLTAQQRRQYGKDLLENRRRLAEIAQRQKQTGLKAALYRMTRKAATDRITAEACRKNIQNIRWRIAEQRDALKTAQAQRQHALEKQQQRDVRKLESQISKAAKEREIESAQSSKVRAEKDQVIREDIRERNRPRWAALYRAQEAERKELEQALSAGGKRLQNWLKHNEFDPFSAREGHLSDGFKGTAGRDAPMKALEARHEAQRDALADDVRAQAREAAQAERKAERAKQQERSQRGKQAAKTSKARPAPPRRERPDSQREQPAKSAGNDNDAQRRLSERIKARREQRQHERERDNGRER